MNDQAQLIEQFTMLTSTFGELFLDRGLTPEVIDEIVDEELADGFYGEPTPERRSLLIALFHTYRAGAEQYRRNQLCCSYCHRRAYAEFNREGSDETLCPGHAVDVLSYYATLCGSEVCVACGGQPRLRVDALDSAEEHQSLFTCVDCWGMIRIKGEVHVLGVHE